MGVYAHQQAQARALRPQEVQLFIQFGPLI